MVTPDIVSDLLNRGWVFWTLAAAFLWSLLGGRKGPPPSGSAQLAFDFGEVEKRSRIPRLQRFYPYTTPFGNS